MILQLKAFICIGDMVNKIHVDNVYFLIGIIGACISFFGIFGLPIEYTYIIGSTLLLIASLHYKIFYFTALEIILIAGHTAVLLSIGPILQLALPTLLCFQLLFFYYLSNQLTNIFILVGISGIALLSFGFFYENYWVYFLGGSAIALYSFYSIQQHKAALIWAILNTLFAINSLCLAIVIA